MAPTDLSYPQGDVKIRWESVPLVGDVIIKYDDLVMDQGLYTAVIISLFSDRRAGPEDELPWPQEDRRGWPGDMISEYANDQIGSLLWLLVREKTLEETLQRAEEYAQSALQWMVEDKIVSKIEVKAYRLEGQKSGEPGSVESPYLGILITLYQTGGLITTYAFAKKWEATINEF